MYFNITEIFPNSFNILNSIKFITAYRQIILLKMDAETGGILKNKKLTKN